MSQNFDPRNQLFQRTVELEGTERALSNEVDDMLRHYIGSGEFSISGEPANNQQAIEAHAAYSGKKEELRKLRLEIKSLKNEITTITEQEELKKNNRSLVNCQQD